jgi:5-hydroxyisourate hydrolase
VSTISTHVLDTSVGKPAAGVRVTFERKNSEVLASATTDADGRVVRFAESFDVSPGAYCLRFNTSEYFTKTSRPVFYPEVVIAFRIEAANEHFHIPLLVSPFGYSTYRGS